MTLEDHDAAIQRYEDAKASGKTDAEIMAEINAEAARNEREKPISHGLMVRNSAQKVVKIIEGHLISKQALESMIQKLLANETI